MVLIHLVNKIPKKFYLKSNNVSLIPNQNYTKIRPQQRAHAAQDEMTFSVIEVKLFCNQFV